MKSLKNIIIICFTVLFFSCNDDTKTNNAIDTKLLPGTWNLTAVTQENGTVTLMNAPTPLPFTGMGKDFVNTKVVISENPNNFSSSGNFKLEINVVGLQKINIPVVLDAILRQGTWSIAGNDITVVNSGNNQTLKITELTANSLKLELEVEQAVNISSISGTAKATTKITLTK